MDGIMTYPDNLTRIQAMARYPFRVGEMAFLSIYAARVYADLTAARTDTDVQIIEQTTVRSPRSWVRYTVRPNGSVY